MNANAPADPQGPPRWGGVGEERRSLPPTVNVKLR
jgi:hypothetical protein